MNVTSELEMESQNFIKATLISSIPQDRYRLEAPNKITPNKGDVVCLDQAFTNTTGEPMVLVYCLNTHGVILYEARVYESELSN